MPLINPHYFRLLKAVGRCSVDYLSHRRPGVRASPHSFTTAARPKELLSKDKTDAQQALLEEAAEGAAQLWGRQGLRSERAEAWVSPTGWCDCASIS